MSIQTKRKARKPRISLKPRKRVVTARLDIEVYARIQELAERDQTSEAAIVRRAVKQFLNGMGER